MSLYNLEEVTDRRLKELVHHAAATIEYLDRIEAEMDKRKYEREEYTRVLNPQH